MTQPGVPLTRPARVCIDPSEMEHLRRRIAATRRAGFRHQEPWASGTGSGALEEVLDLWCHFDVDAFVDSLNAIPRSTCGSES